VIRVPTFTSFSFLHSMFAVHSPSLLPSIWYWLLLVIEVVGVSAALIHVVLFKRDPRSAAYWVALVALVPLVGPLLYLLLGINLIRRSGQLYRQAASAWGDADLGYIPHVLPEWETEVQAMPGLVHCLKAVSRFTLLGGNSAKMLRNGEEAMPAIIAAIDSATLSISLCTYIFEAHGVGLSVIEALERAVHRGVLVRVIVDDAGTRYSRPNIIRELKRRGIVVRRFMPQRFLIRLLTMNLRNHRKIMVVDGRIGFTGGMNIRQGNMLSEATDHPTQDLHFRFEGPVVGQLQRVFIEDWQYCDGTCLHGPAWHPADHEMPGDVSAISLPDGPDDDTQTIALSIATALNEAKREVRILTPYFLPLEPVFTSMIACALRGVKISVIVPAQNNIAMVQWASRTLYEPLLQRGIRIYESAAPFDHSKAMVVDGLWSLIGSANLDPRSLRLNFEFNVACFDDVLAHELQNEFKRKLATSTEITLETLAQQTLAERFRNGVARFFIPLL
jgi:cardiolipin synthase A/B